MADFSRSAPRPIGEFKESTIALRPASTKQPRNIRFAEYVRRLSSSFPNPHQTGRNVPYHATEIKKVVKRSKARQVLVRVPQLESPLCQLSNELSNVEVSRLCQQFAVQRLDEELDGFSSRTFGGT